MHREIGSEFWQNCTPSDSNGIFPHLTGCSNIITTLSGRTALGIVVGDIIKEKPDAKCAYLPSYCCHTMIEPFTKAGISVEFYTVRPDNGGLLFDFDENNNCDIIFLLDYFGFISDVTKAIAKNQKEKGKTVIYDTTHSLFAKVDYSIYDYVFASFRKWSNLNCGFCSKKAPWKVTPSLLRNTAYESLRNTAFSEKAQYIKGVNLDKSVFLAKFTDAEDMLESDYEMYSPDEESLVSAESIDTKNLITLRRENAMTLTGGILSLNSDIIKPVFTNVNSGDCPLFVPVLINPEKRKDVRSRLISEGLYFPVHWPVSSFHNTEGNNSIMFSSELSVVCDQRYNKGDMEYILTKFREAIKLC